LVVLAAFVAPSFGADIDGSLPGREIRYLELEFSAKGAESVSSMAATWGDAYLLTFRAATDGT
jgi:hypothetical protein